MKKIIAFFKSLFPTTNDIISSAIADVKAAEIKEKKEKAKKPAAKKVAKKVAKKTAKKKLK